ncbi:DUF1553 domain-containing protein [bacterium]|nr:DUF1553 domain-containing protein [bacterium]
MFPRFLAWFIVLCGALFMSPSSRADEPLEFNRDIRPILSEHCFACHGFDAKTRQAELRLDLSEGAYADHEGTTAIQPGDLARSEVWHRVSSIDPDVIMPPPETKNPLTPEQIATLKLWIEQGAKYQKHWAFEPPQKVTPPQIDEAHHTVRNEIDRFLIPQMQAQHLVSNPEAPKEVLIRRVSFALTGLPPSMAELETYLADKSSTAYEAMVDRYLNSPRYGEEMARHWLDVARYADTHGLHLDNEREMWAYRDWVIGAFNRNLPFDEFTIEQLAGDLLPNPTKDQLTATGFNRCNVTTSEGGSIAEEFLYRYAVERASTTVQAWMGLTAGCAVCHDHKFDPLSTAEFYSLYAFFYSAADPAMDGNTRDTAPFLSLANAEQAKQLAELKSREHQAKQRLEQFVTHFEPNYQDPSMSNQSSPRSVEDVWLDDVIPPAQRITTTSRNQALWSTQDEVEIPRGRRAFKQYGGDLYQDRFDQIAETFIIPDEAAIEIYVRTDPQEPPKSMLLELVTSRGVRRLLLGDNSKLAGGGAASPERIVRDLPTPGVWTPYRVSAADWKLQPGDVVKTIALEEFGGVCWWDGLVVRGQSSGDLRDSFQKWWTNRTGQETFGVPGALQDLLKRGPDTLVNDSMAPANALDPANSAENRKAAEQRQELRRYYLAYIARPTTPEWQAAKEAYQHSIVDRATFEDRIPGTFTFADMTNPRDAFVMQRGQYDKPGEKVEPKVPAIFPQITLPQGRTRASRLDLAKWLVSADNPLTARVAVNRYWQQFFGTGLVETSDDFGSQGAVPSHPELLDWLAVWYREHDWDTKQLVKLLVTSAAFRQAATVTTESLTADPNNRLLARGPRLRLDAEQLRDNALYVSGLLNLEMGGPGVKPYQPPNIWEPVGYANSNTRYFIQDHGDKLYRRSIYVFLKRTAPPPFMSNFDGPNREQFCSRRSRSNTPLQALQLLNDTQHVEAARVFAERLIEQGNSPEERLTFAYRTVLSRTPTPAEQAVLLRTLAQYQERYRSDTAAASKLLTVGETRTHVVAEPAELAAYTLLCNLILNLDETVNRN